MTREDVEKIIEGYTAHDGYRVERVRGLDGQTLHVSAYRNGRPDYGLMVLRAAAPVTLGESGRMDRQQYLLDALSRYVNTGGTWAELQGAIRDFRQVHAVCGDIGMPPPFELVESRLTEDGYEHVFGARDCRWYIRLVEDGFIDVVASSPPGQESRKEQE